MKPKLKHSVLTKEVFDFESPIIKDLPILDPTKQGKSTTTSNRSLVTIPILDNIPIIEQLPQFDGLPAQYAVFQAEKGEGTGYLHFQLYVHYIYAVKFDTAISHWNSLEQRKIMHQGASYIREPAHVVFSVRSHPKQCLAYCTKLHTRVGGPWYYGEIPSHLKVPKEEVILTEDDLLLQEIFHMMDNGARLIDFYNFNHRITKKNLGYINERMKYQYNVQPIENFKARPWQKKLIDLIEFRPINPRKIHWFVDTAGNSGKTELCKWLILNYKAFYVRGGKADSVKYAYANQQIILFDYPRNSRAYFNYRLIEEFKDGFIQSLKYKGARKGNSNPILIVFSNEPPDLSNFSQDRWDIGHIVRKPNSTDHDIVY